MFGTDADEQRKYEERHPVHAPYYTSPDREREAAAKEAARRRNEEYSKRKNKKP